MTPRPAAAPRHTDAQPGWIILVGTKGHYWHRIQPDWTTLCRPNTSRLPGHVKRWSAEPTGRWDVCPDCRERFEAAERVRRRFEPVEALARALPVPSTQEPELLTVPDDIVPPVAVVPIQPTVPEVQPSVPPTPEPTMQPRPAQPTAPRRDNPTIMAASAFAEQHTLAAHEVLAFIIDRMPGTPRLGASKKAPYVLDEPARQRILAELPAWLAERRNRRPLSQHEQVLQAIHELSEMIVMLAEDVKRLRGDQ